MNGDPQPLAVALLNVTGMSLVQQVIARTQLADAAHSEGYTLVEILSVGRDRRRDVDVYAAAAALARRESAAAVLVHGDVDQAQLARVAADLPVRVVHATARVPAPSSTAGSGRPTGRRPGGTPSGTPAAPARWHGGQLVMPVGAQ